MELDERPHMRMKKWGKIIKFPILFYVATTRGQIEDIPFGGNLYVIVAVVSEICKWTLQWKINFMVYQGTKYIAIICANMLLLLLLESD